MKKSFYISTDIISGSKAKSGGLEKIIQDIESGCKNTDLLEKIIDFLEINFQGFVTLNVEEISIENDFSDQIGDIIDILDEQFPGGCSGDSKIEWYSDYHPTIDTWYKDGSKWRFSQSENQQSSFRMPDWDSDFDDIDSEDGYY